MKCYFSTDGDTWVKGSIDTYGGNYVCICRLNKNDIVQDQIQLYKYETLFSGNELTLTGYQRLPKDLEYKLVSVYIVFTKPRKTSSV